MTQYDSQQLAQAIAGGIVVWLFIALIFVVLYIVALYKILDKAGYSGWLSLLILIPGVGSIIGFVLMLWVAFSDWPVLQELRALRGRSMGGYGGPPAYTPPPAGGYAPAVAPPAVPPTYEPPAAPPPAYQPPPAPPTYEPPAAPPTYEPPAAPPAYEPPAAPPAAPIAPQGEPPATPPPAPPTEEPPAGS